MTVEEMAFRVVTLEEKRKQAKKALQEIENELEMWRGSLRIARAHHRKEIINVLCRPENQSASR